MSIDTSATPAPSEPERSVTETPSARPPSGPEGRGELQLDMSRTFSNTARARGVGFMRCSRNSIGSMLASTAIWSTKDSMAKTLNTWPTARQCLRRMPCDVPRASMYWFGTW